ncbi:MAG: 1-deoxy-D-xylulose-5-phosphate reductoisomerase [Oscillospiraceae bacterium]|jgi:1-deoxy-D-xylulose-5-phosphate reductoisomerase|nr:1-deoxy-D-xylulose-5-phosphate reductoisomerase [Oscillospiraceae bacterium]
MERTISILGSTGSVGKQTADVVRALGIKVSALAAESDVAALEAQAREFSPDIVALRDEDAAAELRVKLSDTEVKVLSGVSGVSECAERGETVVSAISGFAGIQPALTAVRRGARLAIANKETLVAAGELIAAEASESGAEIIPIDSEHSAILQCTQGDSCAVRKLLLTCSGGPFRGYTAAQLRGVTPADALRHPTWSMGAKITIDSATLANKGLELIEAWRLFGVSPSDIEIIIHPQSIVHSAVEFIDGTVIAQMGVPDMRLPIQYALTYPKRVESAVPKLELFGKELTFERPNRDLFPCLKLAEFAANDDIQNGTNECLVFNAANEVAAMAFLRNSCAFADIPRVIESALETFVNPRTTSLKELNELDTAVRRYSALCL